MSVRSEATDFLAFRRPYGVEEADRRRAARESHESPDANNCAEAITRRVFHATVLASGPEFPRYAGHCSLFEYMLRATDMRRWVASRLESLSGREHGVWLRGPVPEDELRIAAEARAIDELQRPLRYIEDRLLQNSVRDVHNIWCALAARAGR